MKTREQEELRTIHVEFTSRPFELQTLSIQLPAVYLAMFFVYAELQAMRDLEGLKESSGDCKIALWRYISVVPRFTIWLTTNDYNENSQKS